MTLLRPFLLASVPALLLNAVPDSAIAQTRIQVQATATTGSEFVGAGAGIIHGLSNRLDVVASLDVGEETAAMRIRLEGAVEFHLVAAGRDGWGLYGGVGLAGHFRGPPDREYLVLFVGVEPNSRRGPFIEAGVGDGLRGRVGLRLPTGR